MSDRRKRNDSSYFKQPEEGKSNRKPRQKDLIDKCPVCLKEVLFEEAERWGATNALYHPDCLKGYQSQLRRTSQVDPTAW